MSDVSRDELKDLIDNKKDYLLVDVREHDELVHGMIPTAHNLPLSELNEALLLSEQDFEKKYEFKLTKKDKIIFHCRSGGRSEKATEYANKHGFNARNYKGSILDWSEIDPNVKAY